MNKRRALTRIELLVLTGAVVFIVFITLLTQNKVMRPAKSAIICQASLKQWGPLFAMYTGDNDGYFFNCEGRGDSFWWMDTMRHLWESKPQILQCPMATKPYTKEDGNPFGGWEVDGTSGSYGLNRWVCNPLQGKTELRGLEPIENYYWRTPNVEGANNIPVFMDAMWVDAWPRHTDLPPDLPGNVKGRGMRRICLNRHDGYVNGLFMDWSVRKIGLKELWKLKWHHEFNTNGPWTKAGGVQLADWPQWMTRFKDY